MNYLFIAPEMTKMKEQAYVFPLGIAYVSSSLKATGRTVFTLNLTYKDKTPYDLISDMILKYNIDVIATGGLTWEYRQIKEIIDIAKQINNNIITIVGGNIISGDPIPAMIALENADFGVIGEGEVTICDLANALENKSSFEAVDGIIYSKDNNWIITNKRKQIANIDNLPMPDYDGFEFGELMEKSPSDLFSTLGKRTAFVVFSRNCPFQCTFCYHIGKYVQRSLDSVFKEINMLVDKYGIRSLVISDELFAYKKEYVEEFCKRIKAYNLNFIVNLRVEIATKELLLLLKESGCKFVFFGVESADDKILKSMKKNITVKQIENAFNLSAEVGIGTHGGLIFGDPEETFQTAINTIEWWKNHSQYPIDLHWIIVFPGTQLYQLACENKIIKDSVQFIKEGCPYINISKMSDEEYKTVALMIETTTVHQDKKYCNVHLKKRDFGKIDFNGTCPTCGQQNYFENLDVFRKIINPTCANCGDTTNMLVCEYIDDTFEKNIKKITQKYNVAVWPVVNATSNMVECAPSLLLKNVYFIDSSPFKQGVKFHGKTIFNSSVLSQKDVQVVILTLTTSVANAIIDEINSNYVNVEKIIYAGELIEKDFNI